MLITKTEHTVIRYSDDNGTRVPINKVATIVDTIRATTYRIRSYRVVNQYTCLYNYGMGLRSQ
jgi:hypothetical protein